MKHEEIRGLITDSVVDPSERIDRDAIEKHLAECEECRAFANDIAGIWNDLGALDVPIPPEDMQVEFGRKLARTRTTGSLTRRIANIAAAVVLLLTGAVLGRAFVDIPEPQNGLAAIPSDQHYYLLIVRQVGESAMGIPRPQLVDEYGNWGESLGNQFVMGAPFRQDIGWVNPSPNDSTVLNGFYMIRARSLQEAIGLAERSPHAMYGGTYEVRELGE